MDNTIKIKTYKPKILTDWIEYFVEFSGYGIFKSEIFAQPYAYILFNHNHFLDISYQDKNIQTQKSVIEPITLVPYTLKARINSNATIFGAKVKSTFLYILTGIPLNLLTGNIFNFEEIFGEQVTTLIEQINSKKNIAEKAEIAESYLLKKINSFQTNKLNDNYNAMKYLTQNFYSVFDIDQLINKLNVSHRTLDRHFLKYTGITPKAMLSLIRFSKTIDYAIKYKTFNLETLWIFGYYDYSHFSKDFKKYCGKKFDTFRQEIKIGENLQVSNQKENILLPEIFIH